MKRNKALTFILLNALTFPLFLILFFGHLPERIPMQFSMSGKVNWSLPLTTGLLAFSAFFAIYVIQLFFRFRKDESYPMKDTLIALFIPEFFIAILIVAMVIK